METLHEFFNIEQSTDHMKALLHVKKEDVNSIIHQFSKSDIINFLKENHIVSGILENQIQSLTKGLVKLEEFPLLVAEGSHPSNGKNGQIHYLINTNIDMTESSNWDFREVMKIPSVKAGQKLAAITLPTYGTPGINVRGEAIPAKNGKPVHIRAGENVVFRKEDLSFYAAIDGQICTTKTKIYVNAVYEVKRTLTMKEGNIAFTGTVVIHGDVPSGFKITADGDVKIFGLVEAATIISKGSVFVSEGLAGLKKGKVIAEEDINIGYINQGTVEAGNNLFVENSIIQSNCRAQKKIYCQRGNIIGGTISAGEYIEAKEIGNHSYTKTKVIIESSHTFDIELQELITKKQELEEMLKKLYIIGKKIKQSQNVQNTKLKLMVLKHQNSILQTKNKLSEVNDRISEINTSKVEEECEDKLVVRKLLHPNVDIVFGKYQRSIKSEYQHVQCILEHNEIVMKYL
ncbi:DUF342 domain-containing protein [Ornithinibacillus halophilus]|uniref:Flagellar Assembly Protein A N-terminal region domain-containing protein n=1 Tax=Ornithinibacillus halophilus TaxID=930117 RepID=A0A1M5CBT0_9BACI|nr:FapA family protein [Ornithinibacillus halophilus]SHF52169.1 hypothetical protein SAMN05216225_1001167 [Ornithinibacillus halophilus]